MSYEGLDNGFSKFNDREDRLNFVRKVYAFWASSLHSQLQSFQFL